MMVGARTLPRWTSIISRALAAVVGGYGFIWLWTAALSVLLPLALGVSPFDAVMAATMSSFLIWAIVAMAIFHTRTALRAWLGLGVGGLAAMATLFALTGRLLP